MSSYDYEACQDPPMSLLLALFTHTVFNDKAPAEENKE